MTLRTFRRIVTATASGQSCNTRASTGIFAFCKYGAYRTEGGTYIVNALSSYRTLLEEVKRHKINPFVLNNLWILFVPNLATWKLSEHGPYNMKITDSTSIVDHAWKVLERDLDVSVGFRKPDRDDPDASTNVTKGGSGRHILPWEV
jgi:hypothetical protein